MHVALARAGRRGAPSERRQRVFATRNTTAARRRRLGSALVYVVALGIVVSTVAYSFLSNVGNEVQVSGSKQARFRMLHSAESGAEIARGRLQISAARQDWNAFVDLNTPIYSGTINELPVQVFADSIPGSPYNGYVNSRARLRSVVSAGGVRVTLYKQIRTADGSEFSLYFGKGGDGIANSQPEFHIFGAFRGKMYFDYNLLRVYMLGTRIYDQLYVHGNYRNDTTEPDTTVFLAGAPRANLPAALQPQFDSVSATSSVRNAAISQSNVLTSIANMPVIIRLRTDNQIRVSYNMGATWTYRSAPMNSVFWVNGPVYPVNTAFKYSAIVEGDPEQGADARLFAGRATVGCTDDMYIRNDIQYKNEATDLLGLVADRNVRNETDSVPSTIGIESYAARICGVVMAAGGDFMVTKAHCTLFPPPVARDYRCPTFRFLGAWIAIQTNYALLYQLNEFSGFTTSFPINLGRGNGWPIAYKSVDWIFDEKVKVAPPPGFPRLYGINPSVIPGTFDVQYSAN